VVRRSVICTPALVLVLMAGLLWLAACGPAPAPAGLDGTSWVLASLDGQDLVPGTTITLVFEGDAFYGYGGCNAYGRLAAGEDGTGSRYLDGQDGSLSIPAVAVGSVECTAPEGVMTQEAAYVEALRRAAGYRVQGDRLSILDGSGGSILVFGK
jgi:heat shock protein HslJ